MTTLEVLARLSANSPEQMVEWSLYQKGWIQQHPAGVLRADEPVAAEAEAEDEER